MTSLVALYSSLVLFFPFWMQIWEKEPISSQHLNTQGHYEVEPQVLENLMEGLPQFPADLRCQIMRELSEFPIPAHQKLMLDWLANEKVPEVQSTILQLLQKTDLQTIPASKITTFLNSDHIATVESAIELFGQLPDADLHDLIPFLAAGSDPVVPLKLRKSAWKAFSKHPDMADLLQSRILEFQQDSSLEIQALALQVASALRPRSPEISRWLDQAAAGPALLRLAAARDPFPENSTRLQGLLEDSEPGIRVAACQANTGALQELLLSALSDPHQGVRVAAVKALRLHPDVNNPQAVEALLKSFSDPSRQVRQEAATTLITGAEKSSGPARELLQQTLTSQNPLQRLHALQALTRLLQRSAVPAIKALIPQETTSENIAAGILALAALAPSGSCGDLLQQYLEHPSPQVRTALAHAVGRLQPPGCEPVLQKLCVDKQSATVRIEAFAAMGYFPQGVFANSLLQCLKNTAATQSDERRNAAWAAGKLNPSSNAEKAQLMELAKRLVLQCTLPVIPGMEPMFEGLDVIGNAMLSLVQLQKRFPEQKEFSDCAQVVLRIYEVPWKDAMNMNMQSRQMPPPVDATSNSMAFQARQWLKGEKITTIEIPSSTPSFSYSPYSETP